MYANYHTHTWRCRHAHGDERSYVEQAIAAGIRILGFSDHTPYPFSGEYYSTFRMKISELEDYVTTILALKKEYQNDIEIHLGLETEYYPAYFENLLKLIDPYPIEYFLLGQHFTNNETDGRASGAPTSDSEVLKRYCSQSAEALKTGCFTYFAHPDLIHFTGDEELYRKEMTSLCRTAKELGIPLEINFLGLAEGRNYPNPVFWKLAGEVGNQVVFGLDAHKSEVFADRETEERAKALAERFGLEPLKTVTLRSPNR